MNELTISRIREAMYLRGMNQITLAAKSGIRVSSLSSYLSGKYEPKIRAISQIAEALEVSPAWLLGFDVSMEEEGSREDTNITIPFVEQKISAGFLQEFLSPENSIFPLKSISVTKKMAALYPVESLVAAEVDGDSMQDVGISDGDYVVFSKGTVKGNGIYVLVLDGVVMVKRLCFNPIDRTIDIISENKAYEPIKVSADRDGLVILGKVAGCIHAI